MSIIAQDEPGKELLLMGNEAIARGALEAGVRVAAAYPGTPSTDIIENLSRVAKARGLYVEWSVNEKVALEVAAAGSYSGLRSLCAMKQNGLNVASDFLLNVNLIGIKAGMVLVACDDPSAHSSNNEQDSRPFAQMADLPLLEPATFQEAKDMTRFAFDLSEELGIVVILSGVTRTSHARGNVVLGKLPPVDTRKAHFDTAKPWRSQPIAEKHNRFTNTWTVCRKPFPPALSTFMKGPKHPELLLVTGGTGWLYSQEALEILGLEGSVGILKIGTSWPLPEKPLIENLAKTDRVLFLEEVEPFPRGERKGDRGGSPGRDRPEEFLREKIGPHPGFRGNEHRPGPRGTGKDPRCPLPAARRGVRSPGAKKQPAPFFPIGPWASAPAALTGLPTGPSKTPSSWTIAKGSPLTTSDAMPWPGAPPGTTS